MVRELGLERRASTLSDLTTQSSRFFLKSEWGPVSSEWPAFSFSKRSVCDFVNREYKPATDFIVYAGTGDPERTKEARYRKRLLSISVVEPGQPVPTQDLVPWESWRREQEEKGKVWPYSLIVRGAWDLVSLPSASELVPNAYRSLGIRRNWGGLVEISGVERDALLPLQLRWVELPRSEVAKKTSSLQDKIRELREDKDLNAALTRMEELIRSRVKLAYSHFVTRPERSLPVGTNLINLLQEKWLAQNKRCALCDQPIVLNTTKKLLRPSPDRRNSQNPSYGGDNLQITHLGCNLAKNDGTGDDFEEWLNVVCGEMSELG